jgi:glycosyltransferase involved in cell wall biosynthesis
LNAPDVTVLITTYNYGRFIESIGGVLSQDYPADKKEIVVVDDGSTDDTADRIRKYGSKIRCFHKPNEGQASALNLGFAKGRGNFIFLLDAGKLARMTAISRVR